MKENAVIFYFRTGVDAFSQKIELSFFFFLIALSYTPVAAMCFLPKHLGEFDRLSCVRTYARIRTDILFSYRR